MNRKAILWIVISLVSLSCLFDIATFFYFISHNSVVFESNPLFLFLNTYVSATISIILILLYKLSINGFLIWLLWSYRPTGTHLWAYFLVFATVIGILIQFYGGYTNLSTYNTIETSEPGTVVPLEKEESYNIFMWAYIIYGIFVLFQASVFMIYERLYRI